MRCYAQIPSDANTLKAFYTLPSFISGSDLLATDERGQKGYGNVAEPLSLRSISM